MMVPPGGFITVKIGNVSFTGLTQTEIVKKVVAYREGNSLPIGDPITEVANVMKTVKGICVPMAVKALNKPKPQWRYIDRINSWIGTRLAQLGIITGSYVEPTEAARRSAICVRCKFNKDWRGCITCSKTKIQTLESHVTILSQNKRTPLHDRLKGCAVAFHENQLAVWLPERFLKHRVNYTDKLPSWCWLGKLNEQQATIQSSDPDSPQPAGVPFNTTSGPRGPLP